MVMGPFTGGGWDFSLTRQAFGPVNCCSHLKLFLVNSTLTGKFKKPQQKTVLL